MWVGILLLFVWLTLNIDLVIFAGVLLAICLRRASEWVRRHTRLPIGLALAVVVLVVVAFFCAIGWYFSQAIASQINQLSVQLPAAATKFSGMVGQSALGRILIEHLGSANFMPNSSTIVTKFFGVASNFVE
ncbi:MAG: AI-2E family transporter, partial [Alphaproteobacteria bacterium]|nr:AI-2E family transporter [Alphaproteobacteria bacterium]